MDLSNPGKSAYWRTGGLKRLRKGGKLEREKEGGRE